MGRYPSGMIRSETKRAHRVRWYGVLPGPERWEDRLVPRTRFMLGRDWGWDVRCSCGWESRTGGAIQASVEEALDQHRWDEQTAPTTTEERA